MPLVEELLRCGQGGHLAKHRVEVLAVGLGGVLLEVERVPISREAQRIARSREVGARDEPVVLHETDEHAAQDPVDRRLRELAIPPLLVALRGPVRRPPALELHSQSGIELGHLPASLAKIILERHHLALKVGKQRLSVDHSGLRCCEGWATGTRGRPRRTFCNQASGMRAH